MIWNAGTIHIQRQVRRVPGHGVQFVAPKTKAGRRMVKLGEGILHVLRIQEERLADSKRKAGDQWQEHNLLFPSRLGTPGDPSNLKVDFKKVLKNAGLPKIRFHDLRHTAASLMVNNGVPPIMVSKILGHSKPSVTLDVYGHLYVEMQTEAARIMDSLVTPIRVELARNEQDILRLKTNKFPVAPHWIIFHPFIEKNTYPPQLLIFRTKLFYPNPEENDAAFTHHSPESKKDWCFPSPFLIK